jgi:hypothetical protein
MAIDPQNKKNIQEVKVLIEDTLLGVSAKIGESIRDAIEDSFDGIDASVLKTVGNDVTKTFRSIARSSDDAASNQAKMSRGMVASKDISKQIFNLEVKREKLARKLQRASQLGVKINEEDLNNTNKALDLEQKQLEGDKKTAEDVEKRTGNLGEVFNRLAKNKFFGSLINADEALKNMRAKAFEVNGKKGMSGMSKNMKVLGAGIGTVFKGFTKGLGVVGLILKSIQFFVDLLIRSDELTTNLQKNFGLTSEAARSLNRQLNATTGYLTNANFNTEQMHKGLEALVDTQGVLNYAQLEQSQTVATLTERLGIAGDEAAFLVSAFEKQGQTTEQVFDNMNAIANSQHEANGFTITGGMLFKELAKTSASVLANFAFSKDELANAVLQTRRFGVSLQQASNIASGLLDFEQSIGAELEAEILLGKQFNFERARALAATGDIAGATEEVLKQTNNLNDEQLRSPIIQAAIAKATGLSADEFMRARKLSQKLAEDNGKLAKKLEGVADLEKRAEIEKGILKGMTFKETMKAITAQEKFNNALSNAKDQFANLVNGGAIDMLTSILPKVLKRLAFLSGASDEFENSRKVNALMGQVNEKTKTNYTASEAQKVVDLAERARIKSEMAARAYNSGKRSGITDEERAANTKIRKLNLDDFTIRANPKDTLVMAGGTKFGDETNKLLKSMLGEMKKSTVLNIDSSNVVQKAIETTYK